MTEIVDRRHRSQFRNDVKQRQADDSNENDYSEPDKRQSVQNGVYNTPSDVVYSQMMASSSPFNVMSSSASSSIYAEVHKINAKPEVPLYENVDGRVQGSDSRVAEYSDLTLVDNAIYVQQNVKADESSYTDVTLVDNALY